MPTAISIGNFDGVHHGHAALIKRCAELAQGPSSRVIAMAFDPHPAAVLAPERVPARLSTFAQRERWLKQAGADEVIRLAPTRDFLSQTPRDFLESLVKNLHPSWIVEGSDFCFGRGRSGTVATLHELGPSMRFQASVVAPVQQTLDDLTIVTVSSSTIRWLLTQGRVRDAARLLGRPFEMTGTVIQGERRGRTIGFPTLNLASTQASPADGVYAGQAMLPDGTRYAAAISVGTKPMFHASHASVVEAYLLDVPIGDSARASLPGLAEYGWDLTLEFHDWLRDQARFGSLPALIDQIQLDCRRTRELIPASNTRPHLVPSP